MTAALGGVVAALLVAKDDGTDADVQLSCRTNAAMPIVTITSAKPKSTIAERGWFTITEL